MIKTFKTSETLFYSVHAYGGASAKSSSKRFDSVAISCMHKHVSHHRLPVVCVIVNPATCCMHAPPEDEDPARERERLSRLLEKLDERLVNGEISETTYKELKSEYLTKLKHVEEEI